MSGMKFWQGCGLAAALVWGASAARAQVGVYGTITGERITSITCGDPQNRCASNDGVARPYGATFGAQYDFRNYGPVLLGFDARGAVLNSNKSAAYYIGGQNTVRHYEALGGVRGTFRTPFHVLRPYVEGAAGLGRTNAIYVAPTATQPSVEQYRNYTQVMGFAGLDLALFPVLDVRIIEFGGGAIFGDSTHSVQQVGIGVVFHLPR